MKIFQIIENLVPGEFSKPTLRWIMLSLAGVGIAFSITMLACYSFKPTPLDPQKAEMKTAIGFVKSQQFLDMNSEKRSRYVGTLVKRYEVMNPREQAEAAKTFQYLRRKKENRGAVNVFWMTFVSKRAEEYHTLSPGQKSQYVDGLVDKMEVLRGLRRDPDRESDTTGYVQRSQRNARLLLGKTTAVERAKISRVAGDVIRRSRSRSRRGD